MTEPARALDADNDGAPDYLDDMLTEVTLEDAVPTALQRIPRWVRLTIYAAYSLAGPVLAYLGVKGVVGVDELTLYATLGPVIGVTAAGNVTR